MIIQKNSKRNHFSNEIGGEIGYHNFPEAGGRT